MLGKGVAARPRTDDPPADLVEAGVMVFRRFVVEHPALFQIATQWAMPDPRLARQFANVGWEAWFELVTLIERVEAAGLLGGRNVQQVAREFHALCEGLGAIELRGMLAKGDEQRVWRDALGALVRGFATA